MWLFGRKRARSVVLIDITAASVAGAYARYEDRVLPTIYFSVHQEVIRRGEETEAQAMLRTVSDLGLELITKGAPVLRRETGSGHVDEVVVSVGGPWHDAQVRHQSINPGKSFLFTKQILSEILASGPVPAKGRVSGGERVIATTLNGFLAPNPLGKEAKRAVVSVLSSTLDREVAEEVRARVRRVYHAHDIHITAFSSIAYAALHLAYPHEKDFLIVAARKTGTDIACVKDDRLVDMRSRLLGTRSLLSAISSPERLPVTASTKLSAPPGYTHPRSIDAPAALWSQQIGEFLRGIAEEHALPRTLFLVTDAVSRDLARTALDRPALASLWISSQAPAIIPVLPEHLRKRVQNKSTGENDLYLSLLAIYAADAA